MVVSLGRIVARESFPGRQVDPVVYVLNPLPTDPLPKTVASGCIS